VATLVTYGNGLKRIEFTLAPGGPRRIVRLGRMNARAAASLKARIEALIADRLANRPHDAELSRWLGGLEEDMLARLRAAGLADGVGLAQTTLGVFLERCLATLSVKAATRLFYGHTRRNLETFFGPARPLREITAADADAWRAWLAEDQKLSPATVARRVVAARTLWRRAIRWKLAAENPFADVRGGCQANESRKRFIPREAIDRVLEAAPDAEWRVIIALARYGGLRTPSETFALRWADIDWAGGTIRVTVPKLAHFEHLAHRTIPLFPELRRPLLELFELAEPGCEYVIVRHRVGALNLRTTFEKIIARAGLKPWPRLFQNLRASRETELMRQYDLATVCRWIGNSPAVAARHYATCVDLDADFRRAAGLAPAPAAEAQQKAQQKAQQSAAEQGCQEKTAVPPDLAQPLEGVTLGRGRQALALVGKSGDWAQQDSNPPRNSRGKPQISKTGAVKSAAFRTVVGTGPAGPPTPGGSFGPPGPGQAGGPAGPRPATAAGAMAAGGADGAGEDFAEAVAMSARLPLTGAGRAEAVRRLLAGGQNA